MSTITDYHIPHCAEHLPTAQDIAVAASPPPPADWSRGADSLARRCDHLGAARARWAERVGHARQVIDRLRTVAERRRRESATASASAADASRDAHVLSERVDQLTQALETTDRRLSEERRHRQQLEAQLINEADALEIGRREISRRARARASRIGARRQRRARTLRQAWAQQLRGLPQRRSSLAPRDIARSLRRRLDAGGHVDVIVVPGMQVPVMDGEPGGWWSESGRTRVRSPMAYSRAGGRPMYVCSTETIEVGRGWLRRHLGGLAADQAAMDIR
jgi:hypothetical protein